MNKKFLSAILFGALMVTSTGTFVSCKDYDDDIDSLNEKVRLTPVLGSGKAAVQKTGRRGTLEVELPAPNDYTMYRYELIR